MDARLILLALAAVYLTLSGCVTQEALVNGTVNITGTISGSGIESYSLEIGQGKNPSAWKTLKVIPANNSMLDINSSMLSQVDLSNYDEGEYTIRLSVTDSTGAKSQDRIYVTVDDGIDAPTKQCPEWSCSDLPEGTNYVNVKLAREQYGSNMNCSVICNCAGDMSMLIKSNGSLEEYDYLTFNDESLTGNWSDQYYWISVDNSDPFINWSAIHNFPDFPNVSSPSATRITFTSDYSKDGSDGYSGFDINYVRCTPYCIASSGGQPDAYIGKVRLNTGYSVSNWSSFSDYTSSVYTNLRPGGTYILYVSVKTEYERTVLLKAWIDYNHNGVFDERTEEIDFGASNVSGPETLSRAFVLPNNASVGDTRMRISMSAINYFSDVSPPTPGEDNLIPLGPCDSVYSGEVEDYTLRIDAQTTSTTTTRPTTTTTLAGECPTKGDAPPCGMVTLSEVISLINQWAGGQASLSDVIKLINMWKA